MSDIQENDFANDEVAAPLHAPDNDERATLSVVLDGFEGPIDLLLTLAREQKVDLSQIAILPIAEQYLAFIHSAQDLNIEIAADYLVMAAWLTYLKSKLLLPSSEADIDEETHDMADALKFQLMRLEAMQKAAQTLLGLPRLKYERHPNGQPHHPLATNTIKPVAKTTLFELLQAYGHIASKDEAETLTITSTYLYSVEDGIKHLSTLLKTAKGWQALNTLLPPDATTPFDRRSALASYFSASLELARHSEVKLRQDKPFDTIWLAQTEKT